LKRILGVFALGSLLICPLARGQSIAPPPAKPLFTRRDAWILGGVTAASIALIQVDKPILRAVQRDSSAFKDRTAEQLKYVNEKSLLALDVLFYGVGKLGHMERLADMGLHGSEAIMMASAVSTVIKSTTGRPRPRTSGQNPFEFKPNKGWTNGAYRSYPSLHQAGSLAFASALVAETGHWWPGKAKVVAPVAYSLAILPGVARIYTDYHWTSDAVLGALIGTYSGLKTVQYAHSHPKNRVDRWMLGLQPGDAPMLVIGRRF
jgi:membrane-associated phospholipid phosphatase